MAKAKKLKVFRTPIGFHDAFVAAPSQKAALEAWGTDTNLFARGAAEQVTDPELTREPLERPGEVIKRLRGSEEEQIAALGNKGPSTGSADPPPLGKGKAAKKPPRPSRTELDRAEQRLAKLEKQQRAELGRVETELERLERQRRELLRKQEAERDALAQARDRAQAAYERAVRSWERG